MFKQILYLISIATIFCNISSCNQVQNSKENITGGNPEERVITDESISERVMKEIGNHPEVPAHLIDVKTDDGIVYLTGSVDNLLSKKRAEEITSLAKGVIAVVNKLDVESIPLEDEEIASRVEDGLYHDPVTEAYEIQVKVNDAHVLLTGKVDSWQEKQIAGDVAEAIAGVKAVENDIAFDFQENRPDKEIKKEVERIIYVNTFIDGELIDVEVEDGVVKLSGKVGSLAEKSRAIANTWVAGVDSLIAKNLKIAEWARDPAFRAEKYVEKTDDQLKKDIEMVFKNDYRVNPYDIDIKVDQGWVTLKGMVENYRAKQQAKKKAESVVGVWDVKNKIKVRPKQAQVDLDLGKAIEAKLKRDAYLNRYNFNERIHNRKVYLEGKVNSSFEKQHAQEIIGNIPGVVDVQNDLKILTPVESTSAKIEKPTPPSDDKIKQNIEDELWWSPFVNESEVHVTVSKGHVTLNGKVDTKLEKQYAEKNALEGGAFTVENELVVNFFGD